MRFKYSFARYLSDRWKSFGNALKGLVAFFKYEVHAKIHLVSAALVVGIALYCGLNKTEWLFILLSIALVFITEMINTSIERTINLIKTEYDPRIRIIKDIAAGFVLVAVVFALSVGAIVILPKLI